MWKKEFVKKEDKMFIENTGKLILCGNFSSVDCTSRHYDHAQNATNKECQTQSSNLRFEKFYCWFRTWHSASDSADGGEFTGPTRRILCRVFSGIGWKLMEAEDQHMISKIFDNKKKKERKENKVECSFFSYLGHFSPLIFKAIWCTLFKPGLIYPRKSSLSKT